MKTGITMLFFLLSIHLLYGQNTIGIPDIINYPKSSYNAGTQNWDIVQDKNGIVYFANNDGLLSFDGAYWKLYLLPNRSTVRSLTIGTDNKIYVGGQDEFGYFSPDKTGRLTYVSLKPLLSPKNYSFTDIWDIVSSGNSVFFRTKYSIFHFNNNSITAYPAPLEWWFLGLSNDHIIAQDSKNGLLEFRNGVWSPFVKENDLPFDFRVTAFVPFGKDSSLICTLKSGLFIFSGNNISKFDISGSNQFLDERILGAVSVNEDEIAIGSNVGGCYIINKKGQIIQNLTRNEGLQNNAVVSLYLDKNHNLWLGLDNGIDFIAYNNAIKHIYPEKLNEGAGYSSIIFSKELYIGTSNGLYKVPVPDVKDLSLINNNFEVVPNTNGSAWNLSEINGNLLLAHHEGAFLIKSGIALPISKRAGYWNFVPFYNVLPSSLVVAGNYNGLDFLQYDNGVFVSKGNLPNFNEAARFINITDNTIWVAHPIRGVYRIEIKGSFPPEVKQYSNKNGLPLSFKHYLYKVKNRILITSESGVYEYNAKKDIFEASAYFENFFNRRNISYLKEDSSGNIWFIEGSNLGVVDLSGTRPQTIYFPELKGKLVSGFEHIYPYDSYNIFVGAEKGFYHINYEQYKRTSHKIEVTIRSVRAIGKSDSLLFGGYFNATNEIVGKSRNVIPQISNNWNSFYFEYSSPSYGHLPNIEYSYFLKGFDKNWSAWGAKTEKEYTNLPQGTYTFQIKVKSNLGNESAIKSYSFTVLPPWHKTNFAYFIYTLLVFFSAYLLYKRQKEILRQQQEKYEKEQKRQQYLHQLELEKSEKEIVTLKNEKLQKEIEYKNNELASVAMHLVQKGELLSKIKEELIRLKKDLHPDKSSDEFKRLIRILNQEDKMDKDWEQFTNHFDNVHSDFLKALHESYPNLGTNELKLCAYLRMNLSSKEIAQLMNISVRGVEISRYRLRKKFQIPTEVNLYHFLLDFSSSKIK